MKDSRVDIWLGSIGTLVAIVGVPILVAFILSLILSGAD